LGEEGKRDGRETKEERRKREGEGRGVKEVKRPGPPIINPGYANYRVLNLDSNKPCTFSNIVLFSYFTYVPAVMGKVTKM